MLYLKSILNNSVFVNYNCNNSTGMEFKHICLIQFVINKHSPATTVIWIIVYNHISDGQVLFRISYFIAHYILVTYH